VAVPFTGLKVTEYGKRYLMMDTTKDALNNAPGFRFDRNQNQWIPEKRQG
jgi:hypothetical protein